MYDQWLRGYIQHSRARVHLAPTLDNALDRYCANWKGSIHRTCHHNVCSTQYFCCIELPYGPQILTNGPITKDMTILGERGEYCKYRELETILNYMISCQGSPGRISDHLEKPFIALFIKYPALQLSSHSTELEFL